MSDFSALCPQLNDIFPILNGKILSDIKQLSSVTDSTYKEVGGELQKCGILIPFNEILGLEIRSAIRLKIAPKFWKHFVLDSESSKLLNRDTPQKNTPDLNAVKQKLYEKFVLAVNELHAHFHYILSLCNRLKYLNELVLPKNEKIQHVFDATQIQKFIRDSLLSQLPPHFSVLVDAFYSLYFRVFYKIQRQKSQSLSGDADIFVSEMQCSGCNFNFEKCNCLELTKIFEEVNGKLLEMQLLDRIGGNSMSSLVKLKIQEHISNTCHGIFDRSHLKQLEIWLDQVVIKWLICIYSTCKNFYDGKSADLAQEFIEGFKVKLTYYMYERFAHSVIDQFFSIIIDFPDSIPGIDDLKICMEKIDMRSYLTQTLKNSLEARILHPGVNTMDILTGYVAAIKAIRHLDNSGVILETVTAPIKEYLKKRSDTVRRVVTGLTEEGPTDLSEELAKGEALKNAKEANNTDELSDWENWQPDPLGIDQNILRTNSSKVMRSADIISMVVDIYGSKELFMVEYRNLMADRLLSQLDFNSEKEVRNLELLKIRFGESLLHSCEVMLKDVTDSKRINSHIHSDTNYKDTKSFDITSLIISAQFWPSFNKENLELPEEIENEFKKYTKSYEAYKGNRTLNWRTVTGRVEIAIEIGDRTLEMTVPPAQAVIIYHFQSKTEWSLEDLSAITKVPPSALRRRISFWQQYGLISESQPGIFKLNEEETQKNFDDSLTEVDDDDLESAMASASDQREEELQVFWSYIVGMLTNLDSLPIERIHQMLKLFASHGGGVEFTQDELKHFLQRKVREHKLLFSAGVYQLAK